MCFKLNSVLNSFSSYTSWSKLIKVLIDGNIAKVEGCCDESFFIWIFNFMFAPSSDNPKSANLEWPSLSSRILSGLRSLCTMLFYLRYSKAKTISAI